MNAEFFGLAEVFEIQRVIGLELADRPCEIDSQNVPPITASLDRAPWPIDITEMSLPCKSLPFESDIVCKNEVRSPGITYFDARE